MPFSFEWHDLITILILVGLEGILSGDNALVLAVMVLPLPEDQQNKALRYGIIGAFVLRTIATLLAVWLSQVRWVALVGGLYLLYLTWKHFAARASNNGDGSGTPVAAARGFLGLTLFWATVVKVELTDIVFAVDSILVAVGMTHGDPGKNWVIVTGGLLGIIMMRLLTMQVLALVKRMPRIIDGAYVVIGWVGIKLILEWAHHMHWVPFEIRREIAILVVVILFGGSFFYARWETGKAGGLGGLTSGEESVDLTVPGNGGESPRDAAETAAAADVGTRTGS